MSAINSPPASTPEAWENEGGLIAPVVDTDALGIVRHMTETFSVGGFRYTNLADAITQAHRTGAAERPAA